MDEQIKKWLFDIRVAIGEIEGYFAGSYNFNEYQKNKMLQRAIERNLEIIGEALGRILKLDSSIQITDSRKIIGLRNIIIHSYDNISTENIWSIITRYLPVLREEVMYLLNK
jgi:uncharacterized protein with HEPN domain